MGWAEGDTPDAAETCEGWLQASVPPVPIQNQSAAGLTQKC